MLWVSVHVRGYQLLLMRALPLAMLVLHRTHTQPTKLFEGRKWAGGGKIFSFQWSWPESDTNAVTIAQWMEFKALDTKLLRFSSSWPPLPSRLGCLYLCSIGCFLLTFSNREDPLGIWLSPQSPMLESQKHMHTPHTHIYSTWVHKLAIQSLCF